MNLISEADRRAIAAAEDISEREPATDDEIELAREYVDHHKSYYRLPHTNPQLPTDKIANTLDLRFWSRSHRRLLNFQSFPNWDSWTHMSLMYVFKVHSLFLTF